ncbi:MAG: glycosyltransferase family 4 protein [Chlorobi bacterium]|nr:glycosyltransferase family 4 protein [Chlorobiota bacterium]
MKKVCFVIPKAYYLFNPNTKGAKDKVGGAQKQAYLLSISLAEDKNFDVHFLVADFNQEKIEQIKNVTIWKSFNFSNNIFKRVLNLLSVLKKINAEYYIFRSADVGVAFAMFYVKNVLKKKVIYMIASDIETSKTEQKKHSSFATVKSMQYVYNKSDILTAQTKQQSLNLLKNRNRLPDAIIKNIYLNISDNDVNFNKKNTILWVGRITKNKKPELFIELAEKYPNEEFIMIAPVVLEHKNYGNKIQNDVKNIKNITLLNYVNPNEINEFYKNAKIYVLSSEFEGFSNTMAEAMIQECPILSYNVNPDNILEDYKCGLCANKNSNLFFKQFDNLLNNDELRKTLGQNGRNYIKNEHGKNKIINTFKSLFDKI